MGDFLIAMGAGIGTAGGFARATGRKVVAFIGDSTFFHSGLSPWPARSTTTTISWWSCWTTAPPA
jgi:TPP-dependent indolepyruvate ferredoxin oxidoreductase alpha subunit